MTVGEIWAVIWAKTRASDHEDEKLAELYDDLLAAKEQEAQANDNAVPRD